MTGNVHPKIFLSFQRCVSYCMVTYDSKKCPAFVSLLSIIIGEIALFLSVFVIPDTTRLRLAIHSAQIHAIGPTNCTLPDDSQKKKKT